MGQDRIRVRFLKSEKMIADELTKDAGKGTKLRDVCNENRLELNTDSEGYLAGDITEAEIVYDLVPEESSIDEEGEGERSVMIQNKTDGPNRARQVRIIHDPQIGPRPEAAATALMGTGGKGGSRPSLSSGRKSTLPKRDEQ